MSDNVHQIRIIPARFAANKGANCRIVDCYVDGRVEKRVFEKEMLEGIENPTYLFIGLMSGKGFMQATFTDAKEFEDLFIEKWGCLVLTAGSSDK